VTEGGEGPPGADADPWNWGERSAGTRLGGQGQPAGPPGRIGSSQGSGGSDSDPSGVSVRTFSPREFPYPPDRRTSGQLVGMPTSGLAVSSLVVAIVAITAVLVTPSPFGGASAWFWGVVAFVAVVLALAALSSMRRSLMGGQSFAVAGLVIGLLGATVSGIQTYKFESTVQAIRNTINGVIAATDASTVQACQAETRSVETAVAAYQRVTGHYLDVSGWAPDTYATNYQGLVSAVGGHGPYLAAIPSDDEYIIEFDSQGEVWVARVGQWSQGYSPTGNPSRSDTACKDAIGRP